MKTVRREKLGHYCVDAGIVWIGDPCYVFHQESPPTLHTNYNINSWEEFCSLLWKTEKPNSGDGRSVANFNGLGFCVSTVYGDGRYSVYGCYDKHGHLYKLEVYLSADEELEENDDE